MGAEAGTLPSRYLAGGLSEKGRRESNEDAAILAVLPPSSALRAYAVLSDGMGGHNAGEVASRLAVEIFKEKVQAFAARPDARALTPAAIEAEIRQWIAEVNREIYQRGKASAEQKGMGATLAFAMILADDRLVVANVGDSKIFVVSGLSVRQLSVDHTALAEQRRALGSDSVAPEDDASNPFAHALTRSLGQEKKVDPDVRSDLTLGTGDAVLLTTDGVTDVLEAERFLTALETTGSLQEAADEIYRLAFEAGSKDNISVALLSRGTPARLGLGKAGQPDTAEPLPSHSGDGLLIAGAASAPLDLPASRPRASRLAAFGFGAFALLAILLAVGIFWRRPPTPPGPPAAAPPRPAVLVSTAPPSAAPVSPPATPLPAAPSPSPSGTETPDRGARAQAPTRPAPQLARMPAEPSFRTPAVLSGLKPLEFPPTPTVTSTATHTPTPTATDVATPTIAAPALPGKAPRVRAPSPASAPAPAATPAPPPAPASAPASAPTPAPASAPTSAPTPGVSF
ncbi:MAG: protein phosphatase 2C domain-containing protein [Thermoanaerobaculia bacterium]|nr:protein phosphatase 2C domain-containing protein [Thermoanaerobaculia bacterium]